MSKLYNPNKANEQIAFAGGTAIFDAEGYTEVADEVAKRLSTLPGYSLVDENGEIAIETEEVESNPTQDDDQTISDTEDTENDVEAPSTEEENADGDKSDKDDTSEASAEFAKRLSKMNVAQLKKYARENNIDLYGATKKDPIISIIMGATNV